MCSSFSTPKLTHLSAEDYNHVYEPAEDSFLMLDALEEDAKYLRNLRPLFCLEVGSGSGVCSTFLANILGPANAFYICTDINPRAAEITKQTGFINSVNLQPVLTDLVSAILPRLENCVDILLFNPPYVVTPSEEVGSSGIEASWAGGDRGRQVIDRMLPLVPKLLSDIGVFYLVVIKENDPDDIQRILASDGLKMKILMSRKSGPEHLSILKFTRT